MNMNWMKSISWLTSAGHFLGGLSAVLVASMFPSHPYVVAPIVGVAMLLLSFFTSVTWLANAGHFLAGLSAILITAAISPRPFVLGIVAAVVTVVIAFKEAVLDPRYESGEDLLTGFYDWSGWMLGQVVACALVYASRGG